MKKKIIETKNAPAALGQYSQGVQAGNFLFTSGQTGMDPKTGRLAGPDIASQTRQTLENLKAILAAGGCSLDQVVKCNVYLQDINEFPEMNRIYAEYFPHNPPARSTVQVQLGFNARVEIDMLAAL